MPIIDDERGVLVLRVVYDGPPRSGKTTTLRTLAASLSAGMVTPEERDGRTLYFDWVDYIGGIFEGRKIRCQIVSVPGQTELAARRKHILASADAVVLVADSTPDAFSEALSFLRELAPWCRERRPPTGIVVQANKRDVPGALHRSVLRDRLDAIAPIALTETVATSGDGIREAFVFGVRLALDRVRALSESGELAKGRPEVDDPETLLRELRALDRAGARAFAASSAIAPLPDGAEAHDPDEEGNEGQSEEERGRPSRGSIESALSAFVAKEKLFAPDPMMPGGFVWPPVDGRALVHEVAQLGLVPTQSPRGDWSASGGGWRFHSRGPAIYDDVNSGRAALIAWARAHASCLRVLSAGRALILADAGEGRMRLWQLVRVEAPLRESLAEAMSGSAQEVAQGLAFATLQLTRAEAAVSAHRAALPCTLWTIGSDAVRQPIYVGLMPDPSEMVGERPAIEGWIGRELGPVLTRLARDRSDYRDITMWLQRNTGGEAALRALAEAAAEVARGTD